MADATLDARPTVPGVLQASVLRAPEDNSPGNAQDWLSAIEKSSLTPRYYLTISLIVLQEMFEFYDFFLVGYLVSVLAPGWHLAYGQSALMGARGSSGAAASSLPLAQLDVR
jgi:putative MFS transporter